MSTPALTVKGLSKRYGGLRATADVSLTVAEGETHALIGPNGAGKTTLISQIFGDVVPDAGSIRLAGADVTRASSAARARLGMARSFQITTLALERTALENAMLPVMAIDGHAFRFFRPARADPALRTRALNALAEMGLAERAEEAAGDLSHGEQRCLELAMALVGAPTLLLLDEPMAGLGPEEGRAMIRHLRRLKGRAAVLLVEHDMDAVFDLADRITVLVGGRVVASGPPDVIRRDPEVKAAYLGEDS